jgi:hypothetical protein
MILWLSGFAAGGAFVFVVMKRAIDKNLRKLAHQQGVLITAHLEKNKPRWMS